MSGSTAADSAETGEVRVKIHGPKFAQVPHSLMAHPDVRPNHIALYAAIHSLVDWKSENGHAARSELLRRAGFTKREQLYAARQWLADQGFLTWHVPEGWVVAYQLYPHGDADRQLDGGPGHESGPPPVTNQDRGPGHESGPLSDPEPEPIPDQPLLSTDVDAQGDLDAGFEEFWERWPKRNGKKVGKEDARRKWRKLNMSERRAAWLGAVNYADACERDLPGVGRQDAFRWLQHRRWVDWQTPAQDERGNGQAMAYNDPRRAGGII